MAVQMNINDKLNGIELIFPKKPSRDVIDRMKEKGFRWHSTKQLWYARKTEDRMLFAQSLAGISIQAPAAENSVPEQEQAPALAPSAKPAASREGQQNCFAAHYSSIGDTPILDSSEVSFFDQHAAYFRDLNIYFWRTSSGDSASITCLDNARKVGKLCQEWVLNPMVFRNDVCIDLCNEEDIHTVRQLYDALMSGKALEHVKCRETERKGIDVFSPFVETAPLKKAPATWTKRNFTQAIMSGQIYRGEIRNKTTDDYRLDASEGFSKGRPLSMPACAKSMVEGWHSLDLIYPDKNNPDKNGHILLHHSSGSTSKTFVFDLSCNIQESKYREDEHAEGLRRYNQMMKASCVPISEQDVQSHKVYSLQTLEENRNTGVLEVKTENLQGRTILERMDSPTMHVVSQKEFDIKPDFMYAISGFDHELPAGFEPDDRIIRCDRSKCIVTGQALVELTAEGVYLPFIHLETDRFGPTYEKAKASLESFARGEIRALSFQGDNREVSYARELLTLEREHARALALTQTTRKPSLDVIIGGASARKTQQQTETDRIPAPNHSL